MCVGWWVGSSSEGMTLTDELPLLRSSMTARYVDMSNTERLGSVAGSKRVRVRGVGGAGWGGTSARG